MNLTVLLLGVAAIGLGLTLLSLLGADFSAFDVELGDSSVGLLSLLAPGVTLGSGVAGLLLAFDLAGTTAALLFGALAFVLGVFTLYPLLRVLLTAGRESEPTELAGHPARVVETAGRTSLGLVEVVTENGSMTVPVYVDPGCPDDELRPGSTCYLTAQPSPDHLPWYATSFADLSAEN